MMLRSKLNRIPWIILRLGSAYGPNMRKNAVISLFIRKAKNKETINISGDGSQKRQFTHAQDIARAFEKSIKSDLENEIFNIVSGEIQTIRGIANLVCEQFPTKIKFGPKREGDVESAKVSSKKARRLLKWDSETKFEDGLKSLMRSVGD